MKKQVFNLSKVGIVPSPTGRARVGVDCTSSKQSNSPSLEFLSSLSFAKKFFSLQRRDRRTAFTLAEVLITLGVIGVIAAMTLPSVIKHYQQQATVNQLKKAYSEFSQALHKAEVDNGLMETWNFANLTTPLEKATYFGENYLFPYIKTVEKCVPSSNKCWADKITNVSGNVLGNSSYLSNARQTRVSFVTASGYSGYYWLNGSGIGMWYWVDLNGPKKGPNKISRDIFAFQAGWGTSLQLGKSSSSAIVNNLTRDEMITQGCSRINALEYSDGQYCGALIMYDGWKIGEGYPW